MTNSQGSRKRHEKCKTIDSLPSSVLSLIFGCLSVLDVHRGCQRVCSLWRRSKKAWSVIAIGIGWGNAFLNMLVPSALHTLSVSDQIVDKMVEQRHSNRFPNLTTISLYVFLTNRLRCSFFETFSALRFLTCLGRLQYFRFDADARLQDILDHPLKCLVLHGVRLAVGARFLFPHLESLRLVDCLFTPLNLQSILSSTALHMLSLEDSSMNKCYMEQVVMSRRLTSLKFVGVYMPVCSLCTSLLGSSTDWAARLEEFVYEHTVTLSLLQVLSPQALRKLEIGSVTTWEAWQALSLLKGLEHLRIGATARMTCCLAPREIERKNGVHPINCLLSCERLQMLELGWIDGLDASDLVDFVVDLPNLTLLKLHSKLLCSVLMTYDLKVRQDLQIKYAFSPTDDVEESDNDCDDCDAND